MYDGNPYIDIIISMANGLAFGIMDNLETFNSNLQKEKYIHNYANDNALLLTTNSEDEI